jgi:hypothetical protein
MKMHTPAKVTPDTVDSPLLIDALVGRRSVTGETQQVSSSTSDSERESQSLPSGVLHFNTGRKCRVDEHIRRRYEEPGIQQQSAAWSLTDRVLDCLNVTKRLCQSHFRIFLFIFAPLFIGSLLSVFYASYV